MALSVQAGLSKLHFAVVELAPLRGPLHIGQRGLVGVVIIKRRCALVVVASLPGVVQTHTEVVNALAVASIEAHRAVAVPIFISICAPGNTSKPSLRWSTMFKA